MRWFAALLALAATFFLAGCTGSGIAELDRDQLDSDKLDLPSRYSDSGFDQKSIRWLAEHDGVDFYAARSSDGTCLILVRDGDVEESFAGCGNHDLKLSGAGYPSVRLYIDASPPMVTESMIELTPNLYVMEYVPK